MSIEVRIVGDAVVDTFTEQTVVAGEWVEHAACSTTSPDLFFPERGASTREAKAVCAGCPVRVDCLEYALEAGEKFGVWGGKSEKERRTLRRHRLAERRAIGGAA